MWLFSNEIANPISPRIKSPRAVVFIAMTERLPKPRAAVVAAILFRSVFPRSRNNYNNYFIITG